MKTLDEICLKHGTDKATSHPIVIPSHGYAPVYDAHFSRLRHDPVKLLEIGVGGAESIKSWLEYFDHPDAKIFGVDIVQNTNEWNIPIKPISDAPQAPPPDPRYTFCQGDQGDEVFWKCFVATYGGDWTIIIDDGSHVSKDIIVTFSQLWSHVSPKGLYCIEDLAVAYGVGSIFCPDGWQNHMAFVKDKLDDINLNSSVRSMNFTKELCILEKP